MSPKNDVVQVPKSGNAALAFFAISAGLVLLWLALWLRPVLSAPHDDLGAYIDAVYDDCYYYLTMAANIAESGRSTMDGVTVTNGYQFLWQFVLAALVLVVGSDGVTLVRAIYGLAAMLVCAGLAVTLPRRRDFKRTEVLCAGVGLCFLVLKANRVFLVGMETTLVLPLVVPLLLLLDRARSRRDDWYLSALLALLFLIRIDGLAVAIAVLLIEWLAPQSSDDAARGRAFRRLAVLVPVVIVYLVANQLIFGTPVPVSGIAKAIGGRLFSNWGMLVQYGSMWKTLLLAIVAWAATEGYARMVDAPPTFRRAAAILLLAALGQQFYYAAFSSWYLWDWYYYLQCLTIAAIVARATLVAVHSIAIERWQLPLAAGLWFLGALALVDLRLVRDQWFPRSAVAVAQPPELATLPSETAGAASLRMLHSLFPTVEARKSMVGMGDTSGALAFWGRDRLSVAQLEGLTLDMDYIRARKAGNAEAWVDARYQLDYFAVDREQVPLVTAADGRRQYAVAEPISGRVVIDRLPVFCFPESALVYDQRYINGGIVFRRMAFRYPGHERCSAESLELIESARIGQGLRQFSLPEVYARGFANAEAEHRDRHLWQ